MDFSKQRTICESNFVFTLWKYPYLYGKFKSKIEKLDKFFSNKDANFYYVLGKQMFCSGYQQFDQLTVMTFVNSNSIVMEAFKKKGGYDIFDKAKDLLLSDNIDGYFNDIVKLNVLDELQNQGIDIEKDYEKLKKMSVEQIRLFYNHKITNVFMQTSTETKIEDMFITDDDINDFDSGYAMGLSIAGRAPILNYEILGLNRGLTFVGGISNAGKTSFTLSIIVMSWMLAKIKCCIISNEQTIKEFKQFLIAMSSYELFGENSITKRRVKIGGFTNDEKSRLDKIKNHINENYAPYLKFAKVFNYNIEDVSMIVETMSARGFEGFVYDVFKADDRASGTVVGEMVEMSKQLFSIAHRTDTSIVSTIQLGISFGNVRYLNMGCVSTSRQTLEVATEGLFIRSMWNDEVTGAEYDIKIYNYLYDKYGQKMLGSNGEPLTKSIEIHGDDYKDIKLLFLAKTRNSKEGIVIAYRFNGDYNLWEELGYCNPHFKNRNER